jgi:hypothetical protein
MPQTPRVPDLNAQRAAMQKLAFLIGKWTGEACLLQGPGQSIDLLQTEEAQYKLDGLLLVIEGVGRSKSDNQLILQALAVISFDDESATYQMRAFNDGRFLESELKLLDEPNAISWGFALGPLKSNSVLRLNNRGEWTEFAELIVGSAPPKKLIELTVRRVE